MTKMYRVLLARKIKETAEPIVAVEDGVPPDEVLKRVAAHLEREGIEIVFNEDDIEELDEYGPDDGEVEMRVELDKVSGEPNWDLPW
jgi:hypothetical protein